MTSVVRRFSNAFLSFNISPYLSSYCSVPSHPAAVCSFHFIYQTQRRMIGLETNTKHFIDQNTKLEPRVKHLMEDLLSGKRVALAKAITMVESFKFFFFERDDGIRILDRLLILHYFVFLFIPLLFSHLFPPIFLFQQRSRQDSVSSTAYSSEPKRSYRLMECFSKVIFPRCTFLHTSCLFLILFLISPCFPPYILAFTIQYFIDVH